MTATVVHIDTTAVLTVAGEDAHSFLAATPMCDAGDASVRDTAVEVTRDARTPREAAVALFYWVRDQVTYTMGDWNWRASETLRLRRGTCSNKANLMVAMARSIGIPAGFHVQFVTTPSYFSGSFIPLVQRSVRDKAIHVYVTLFLDGRWVKCDPTDDKALSDAIEEIVPHAKAFDFDGEHDAVIPFAEGSVLSDHGPFPDIDADLSRDARIGESVKRMFAAYVAYMREYGARYRHDSAEERNRIEADFRGFLAATEPEAYAALVAVEAAAA
jgi:transglutaminase-like putative cysteine protease